MGLLDNIFGSTGDPERDAARNRGLLAAGLQLMQAKGRLFPALGQAGMAGLGASDQYAQQSQAAQARQLQQRMAQMQLQQAQRQQELEALPGQFYRAPSAPAVDATGGMETAVENPNNASGPGGFDMPGYIQALMARAPTQALQLQQMMQREQPKPLVTKPGEIARNPVTGEILWQNPAEAKTGEAPSAVKEYEFAKAQGYKGTFEQWKRDQKPEGVNVSFGSPIPAINPKTGEPEFVRPDNKGGMNFTGVRPPPQNRDTKMPAEIQRMNIAADTMEKQLTRYETWLKSNNPRDPTVQMSPARRAEMQSLMKNLQLQYKELAALGALTGPDLDLMEKALSDPFSVRGAFYGKDGLLSQIGQARELVKERREAMAKSQAPQGGSNVVDFGSLK